MASVNKDSKSFWQKIGKIGIGEHRKGSIPMEVLLENGQITTDAKEVLQKWGHDYETLFKKPKENRFDDKFLEKAKQHLNNTKI
jgi:hypothetical protein